MIYYLTFNDNGNIIQQGHCDVNEFNTVKLKNQNVLRLSEKLPNLDRYKVVDGQLVSSEAEDFTHKFKRYHSYPNFGEQLDCLYKDIQAGLFGEAAKTGSFAQLISGVKQQYPKP